MLNVQTKPVADGLPQPFPRRGRDDAAAANVEHTGGGEVVWVVSVDLASIDGAAEYKMVASPAVVGAKPVGRDGPAELARGEHRHVLPPALTFHLVDEGTRSAESISANFSSRMPPLFECVSNPPMLTK